MKAEQVPPNQQIQHILQELRLKTIQELINGDSFNIDTLAKTSSLHPIIIREKIKQIHSLVTSSPVLGSQHLCIQIGNIVKKWIYPQIEEESQGKQKINWTLSEGDTLEIVGRVGGGKTHFMNQIIIECLLNNIELVYLDGSNNFNGLIYRINQQAMTNPDFVKGNIRLRKFSFKTQSELIMILHSLGNWSSQNKERPWIFIDSLIRTDELQIEQSQSVNALEFKSAEKMKRMMFQLSKQAGAIVYTTKCMNLNGLFDTIYQHEKHRPKGVGACSKQWDSISNKTICVDYGRTKDRDQYFWINATKDINCSVYKFSRKR